MYDGDELAMTCAVYGYIIAGQTASLYWVIIR